VEKNFLYVENVLSDETFFAWYFKVSDEKIHAWNKWVAANPQYKPLIDEAVTIMSQLHLIENNVTEQRIETSLQRLNSFLDIASKDEAPVQSISKRRSYWWIAAALLLIFAGITFWKFSGRHDQITFVANYGETSTRQLPDGSEVTLNANSMVTLEKKWPNDNDREVWLKGEAFFHVKKTPDHNRFIVHTDHFDVIVTGTQFNVVNRNGQSNVMLNEGKVIIKTTNGKEINMDPGEFLEFKNNEAEKRIVKNDSLLAWKDKRLIFDNTPLSKVVMIIKDHYGVDVELADDSVSNKTISGMLPNDNLDVLLQAINATNDLEVVHHGDKITIGNRQ
jgi:ferric-dicitrate binding protein FerR (iron transport regulator)